MTPQNSPGGEKTGIGGWKVDNPCYLMGKYLVKLSPFIILEAYHAPMGK